MSKGFTPSNRVAEYRLGDSSSSNPTVTIGDVEKNQTTNWLNQILRFSSASNVTSSTTQVTEPSFEEIVMEISNDLYTKYPLITIDDEVLGEPRLVGTRLSVSNVLTAFTMYDSIEEIIEDYEGKYTKKQLKDAVKFARDFLDSFHTSER